MNRKADGSTEKPDARAASEEILNVKTVIASFLIAMKNYALYPERHEICQKSLAGVRANLDTYFSKFGGLQLTISRESLLYRGEVVHTEPPAEGSLPFTLYRDGMHWIEFKKDLQMPEIAGFFNILNTYRIPQENAESDLITAMWEANFPHIAYEADDGFSDSEALINLSELSLGRDRLPAPEQTDTRDRLQMPTPLPSLARPGVDDSLWKLTDDELKSLEKLVIEEECREGTEDILDVLDVIVMVIVREDTAEEDSRAIMDFLKEQLSFCLELGDIQCAYRFLERMYGLTMSFEIQKPWAVPLLQRFFDEIAGPDFLQVLQNVWHILNVRETGQQSALGGLLVLLPPKAVKTLGPMLQDESEVWIRELLTEVLASLAARDIAPLEDLLAGTDESLVRNMVNVLGRMKGERPQQLLLQMLGHASAPVRSIAVSILSSREAGLFKELFSLVDDPAEQVWKQALRYFGRQKSMEAESMLLDFLRRNAFTNRNRSHIVECYRALGRCGSSLSIPFLKERLLGKPILFGNKRAFDRQCAAVALMAMQTESAGEIIEKAENSLYPTLKRAAQRGREFIQHQH